jgi:hypothetical protein
MLAFAAVLAATLAVAAFAFSQRTETQRADAGVAVASASVPSAATVEHGLRLQSLQDGFLPPTVTPDPAWARLQLVQDGYLSPAVPPPPIDPKATGSSGDRTNQPR